MDIAHVAQNGIGPLRSRSVSQLGGIMKYIIEGKKTQNDLTVLWVRSRWYPGEYFEAEAHRIIGESASRNVQYRMTPVMPEEHMKYKIELWCGYDLHGCWSRAWSYPGEYTKVKAEELISRPGN